MTVRCARCGARFWRSSAGDHTRSLALACTGLLLLMVAVAFPLASLDIRGLTIETTLTGTARTLMAQDMPLAAALVLFTLVAAPALQLAALCWLLLPSMTGLRPGTALAARLLPATRPWSMIEVFMLGALVSLAKLAEMATLTPGVALFSLAMLMLVMSAAYASFDVRELWAGALRSPHGAGTP